MNYGAALASALSLIGAAALAQVSAPTSSTAPPSSTSPPAAAAWLPRGGAELQVLDKVDARSSTLDIRDGASGTVGSLTISVQSCLVRPPDQPSDATAFLVVTDSHPDAPGFRGWMFRSDPAASMLQHPIYDVRVLGCRA